jgi:lactoylglutathione lyase
MPRLSTFTFTKLVVDDLILGFTTRDLPALLDRVRAAGGGVHSDIRAYPDLNIRVAFATDPEGHLIEIVERSE